MNGIAFVVAFALFVGGILLMGYAGVVAGFESLVFFAGIMAASIAVAIPFHLMKRIDS